MKFQEASDFVRDKITKNATILSLKEMAAESVRHNATVGVMSMIVSGSREGHIFPAVNEKIALKQLAKKFDAMGVFQIFPMTLYVEVEDGPAEPRQAVALVAEWRRDSTTFEMAVIEGGVREGRTLGDWQVADCIDERFINNLPGAGGN